MIYCKTPVQNYPERVTSDQTDSAVSDEEETGTHPGHMYLSPKPTRKHLTKTACQEKMENYFHISNVITVEKRGITPINVLRKGEPSGLNSHNLF
jgi:hypothetical protein